MVLVALALLMAAAGAGRLARRTVHLVRAVAGEKIRRERLSRYFPLRAALRGRTESVVCYVPVGASIG
jgi:hypothetical protein